MSGAEAVVALGIASNVIQFIDFTAKLCSRIREYASGSSLPKKLAAQADRLSDLLSILESVNESSAQGALSGQTLARCQIQAQELSDFLDDLKIDGQKHTWAKNAKKAFKSLNRSDQIEELQAVLDNLVRILSLQLQVDTRSTTSQVQKNTVSILQRQLEQTSLLRQVAGLRDQASHNTDLSQKVLWMVSIGRNPDFVGRTAVMSTLASKLTPKPDVVPTAVLYGLGGVGKSQIALEYAYRERGQFANKSVFWVHASNADRFDESYKRIASELQISGRDDPSIDVLQLVRNWLEMKYECRWLMIVDNVDDHNMFFETQPNARKALREYIPQTPKGSILYTTRNRNIGMDLALDRAPITVPSMDTEEAQLLLGPRIRAESVESEQLELLNELFYLPLAISQAAAFMAKRQTTIAKYLETYRGNDSTRIKLLGQRFNHHGREAQPLESVLSTWLISFNHINQENPPAAKILQKMSFMDQHGIPFSLLMDEKEEEEDDFEFKEAISLLEAFSLVTLDVQQDACNIHRLVTVAIQAWLGKDKFQREKMAVEVLETLSKKFPDGNFETWPTCGIYFPHADKVLRSNVVLHQATSLHAKAYLLLNMSNYLRMQGRYKDSDMRAMESKSIFERLYGCEHADTLSAIASYARTLEKLGRYHDAVSLQRQVFEAREKTLGIGHRATLESMDALGSSLQRLGQYTEAEKIHRREFAEKEKLKNIHPEDIQMQADTLVAIKNIARVLSHKREFAEAEELYRRVLVQDERILGRLHPDVFITRGELASMVRDQDKLNEAEQMYIDLLNDRSKVLGDRHPETLITSKNLATVSARQGHLEEAETRYRDILHIELEIYSENHPTVINTRHNLACSAFDRKDYRQAADEFKKVMDSQKVVLGPAHPFTLRTRRNCAMAIRKSGDLEQGNKLNHETLNLCDSLVDNKVAEQLETLEILASGLQEQERHEETELIRRQELELRKASGEDEARIQSNMQDLAVCLSKQGKHDETKPIYEEMLVYAKEHYGPEHKESTQLLFNLALTYRELKHYEIADSTFSELVEIQSGTLGKDHPSTLDCMMQHAWVLQQRQKYVQAEDRYRFLLETRGKSLGPEHWNTLMITYNLAIMLKCQNDALSEEAITLFRRVLDIEPKALAPDNEELKGVSVVLVDHLRDCARHAKRELDAVANESRGVSESQKDATPE